MKEPITILMDREDTCLQGMGIKRERDAHKGTMVRQCEATDGEMNQRGNGTGNSGRS